MDDEEFNRIVNGLIEGLPITLVMTRLVLMLRYVVDASMDGASTLREYADDRRLADMYEPPYYRGEDPY